MGRFFIWDTRSFVGNAVLWWGPDRAGYTTNLDAAGLYSEDEAKDIQQGRSTDRAVPEAVARAAVRATVDASALREELAKAAPS